MDNSHLLAIVIPAYKAKFLYKTLSSLSSQTEKRFSVYIGDDNSPENLLEIVSEFEHRLDLRYTKFSNNMGGVDLVAHWSRCLELIEDEEWFIMFSDDDLMDEGCVESLYRCVDKDDFDVLHYNLKIINEIDEVIKEPSVYPQVLSSLDFFDLLYSGKIDARMPEFIFSTKHFKANGGFISFPMAMRTDNATVIQCAFERGIRTIEDSFVRWRLSGENVSSGQNSVEKHLVFYRAIVSFFNWLNDFGDRLKVQLPWNEVKKLTFIFNQDYNMRRVIGIKAFFGIMKTYNNFPKKMNLLTTVSKIIFNKAKSKVFK